MDGFKPLQVFYKLARLSSERTSIVRFKPLQVFYKRRGCTKDEGRILVSNPYRYSTNKNTFPNTLQARIRVSNPYRYSTNLQKCVVKLRHKVSNPYRYSTNNIKIIVNYPTPNRFKPLQVFYKLSSRREIWYTESSFKPLQVSYKHTENF